MKQLILYVAILFCAFCVCGELQLASTPRSQRNVKNGTYSNNAPSTSSEKNCQSWGKTDRAGNRIEDEGRLVLTKPKLVVTFLANTNRFEKPDGFGGGPDPPLFFDPFQRLLQFFFSSFTRDMSPRLPEKEETALAGKEKADSSGDFDWFGKKDDGNQMLCEHGINGFCRSCHMQSKSLDPDSKQTTKKRDYSFYRINILNSLTTGKTPEHSRLKKSNGTAHDTTVELHSTAPDGTAGTTKKIATKHKRHYFLSISGGTDTRAAAPKISEINRNKRDTKEPNTGAESIFKILEETIFESLSKDGIKGKEEEMPVETTTDSEKPLEEEAKPLEEGETADSDSIPSDDNKDNEGYDLYDESIPPHVAQYSHGWTYFFLITLPVLCILLIVIILLCIFLRTRGWCCQLFLTDPQKNLEARQQKKPPKEDGKKDKKQKGKKEKENTNKDSTLLV